MVVPFVVAIPLFPIAWLLSFVTDHHGAISDAILIWYAVFTYFWATYYPFWTTRIVHFFGLFNLLIALGYGSMGVKDGISHNLFFFMDAEATASFWIILGIMSVVYLVLLYFVAKKGHQKYLAKIATIEAQKVEEAAQFTTCPFCAETILVAAKVCKHCGRDI